MGKHISSRWVLRSRFTKTTLYILVFLTAAYSIPIPQVGEPVETLGLGDSRFLLIRDIKVHYVVKGSGEPLFILLHGFGANAFTWRNISSELARYGTVVAFDRPGFGLTERKPPRGGFNPYSIEGQVSLSCEFIKSFNSTRIVLIGHSAGGGLALLLTTTCDIPVEAVVLIAPAWRPHERSIFESILFNLPLVGKYGPLFVRNMVSQLEGVLHRAWYDKSKLTNETIELYKYPLRARDWDRGLFWLIKYRGFPDITRYLNRIKTPVLIVHGVEDEIVSFNDSIELGELMRDHTVVYVELIEKCGHVPHEERPGVFIEILIDFLMGFDVIR